jgi:integrase
MSALRKAVEEYLALHRRLGAGMRDTGSNLHRFADFLEQEGATVVTTDLALRFACQPVHALPSTWASRLTHVRRFAAWHSAVDPRTEVPPTDLLPHPHRRKPPHIYSDEEIGALVWEASRLPSPTGLRARTLATLLGLLPSTGLRIGEALSLDRDDVDLAEGILFVRRGKFGKSRFIPVHDSTCDALGEYARDRDRLLPHPKSPAFFVGEGGRRPTQGSVRHNFVRISRVVGLRSPTDGNRYGHGPRLHDMRHRFAVARLLAWYREGRDVDREMPKLSTYLGHVHVSCTYWYLEAVPELLRLATERLERAGQVAP